jgi:DNA-binding winged helix-turn-helix (wHTH) protein
MATRAQTSIAAEYAYRSQRVPGPSATAASEHSTMQRRELPDLTLAKVRLGRFDVDLRAGELRTGNESKRLQEQPFRILQMLVQNDGEIVTREEIRQALWGDDIIVDFDHSINTAVKNLRQSLRDSASHSTYVETIARRGYRLMLPVQSLQGEDIIFARQSSHPGGYSSDSLEGSRVAANQPLRAKALDGGIEKAARRPMARAPGHSIWKVAEEIGQAPEASGQRRELEHRIRRLERLLLSRIRRQHHRRRSLSQQSQAGRAV